MARHGMSYQEACRVTPLEFHFYQKAFLIERQEYEYRSAVSAWYNQSSKATKGKSGKSAYRNFNDFYDYKKKFAEIFFKEEKNARRVSLAELNKLANEIERSEDG